MAKRLDKQVETALQTLADAGMLDSVQLNGRTPRAGIKLPPGTYDHLQEIARPRPVVTFDCEMGYPMGGQEREPIGVEKIRELAYPVLVCRFEDISAAGAMERRDEINNELRCYGWPELGDLMVSTRQVVR